MSDLREQIQKVIDDEPVTLFMKGTPDVRDVRQLRPRAQGAAAGRCAGDGGRRAPRPADPPGALGDLRLADDPAGLRQGRADRRRRHRRGAHASGELEQTLDEKLGADREPTIKTVPLELAPA